MNPKLITFDNVPHSEVQSYSQLDGNLKTSLCYIGHCFKTHFLKEFGIACSCAQLTLNTYILNHSLFSLKILATCLLTLDSMFLSHLIYSGCFRIEV